MGKWVIGVDEVGRGPLAGPITLAVFFAHKKLRRNLIKLLGGKIKDSKKFSPTQRYTIYRRLLNLKKDKVINFEVSHISNKVIDQKGISYATRLGTKRCLKKLEIKSYKLKVLLDGSLKAPEKYTNQKTIIGGDSKDIFIACASIVAKVRRDRLMCRLASKYPLYALEIHKGYGTKLHYSLLQKHGLSEIHRKTFCKNLTK